MFTLSTTVKCTHPPPPDQNSRIKGTVRGFSSDPQCKDANARFTKIPLRPWPGQY